MGLADEKYVLLTTFKRDGSGVATPVWIAGLPSGELGFWSSSNTGKAKRLRHTSRVNLQACDAQGKITHGPVHEATAQLVTGPQLEQISAAIRAKYGVMTKITSFVVPLLARLRGKPMDYGNIGVLITLGDAAA